TEDGRVAVFRGVQGQIAGLDLSAEHSVSPARLDDLTLAAQEQVKQGIPARDEPDAERRLAELTSDDPLNPNLKPICQPTPTPTPEATTPEPTRSPVKPGATRTASGSARPVDTPTPAPTETPDVLPSDTVPPADPAGCR
ncbi:protein phosphatase, partial [Micromonospora sp. DH15]|nr:protein phosphatase [Micromonospora sp. DH15]